MLHRFPSEADRAEWVEQDLGPEAHGAGIRRRAVTTRGLPHGWTVHPYGGTVYIDHKEDGEPTRVSYEQYLGWRKVEV